MPEVDDDQLAALRRLRAAFGPIEIIAVTSNDATNEATMAGTRRMIPEEQGEAHALAGQGGQRPGPAGRPPGPGWADAQAAGGAPAAGG